MKTYKFIFFLIFFFKFSLYSYEAYNNKFVIGQHGAGFFSIFLGVLNKLDWAEKKGKIPVVYWGPDCIYYSAKGYNGSYNAWEYYFKPVSELEYHSRDFIHKSAEAPDGSYVQYKYGAYDKFFHEVLRESYNKIFKKYIHIKKPIRDKINNFFQKHMKNKVNVGVHLRGTDKKYEARVVEPHKILNKVKTICQSLKQDYRVFLATDEEKLLDLAKNYFKDKLVYYNSHRSKNGVAVHYSKQFNPAILGEEILIEAKVLSRCDYFVHTLSNVATAVMIFNPKLKNYYLTSI